MGPPNSHFETWRRTQTVRDFPKRTVSEAYPCTTYTCLDPCTHRNGCVWNLSNESRPMRRPWGRRFEMRHDGSTQAPSDSYWGPGVTNASELRVHASTQWQGFLTGLLYLRLTAR